MILYFNYYKTKCEIYSNTSKIFDLDFYSKFVCLLMRIQVELHIQKYACWIASYIYDAHFSFSYKYRSSYYMYILFVSYYMYILFVLNLLNLLNYLSNDLK